MAIELTEITLKFIGTEPINKETPFEDSEFLYFTTNTLFEEKLPKLIEEIEDWRIDEHQLGDAYFAGAQEVGEKTYFSLRMNYRSMPPLTKEESKQLIYDIIESFSIYLNEIEWLKDRE